MIEVKNISKLFADNLALDNVGFTLKTGDIAALVGENGAGKSTLMRIMCGYVRASSGSVKIAGYDIERERIRALSHVGYVPEMSSLYEEMSVYDFLNWAAGIWQVQNRSSAIMKAAAQMQVVEVMGAKIESLSKGFKKRVQIASALLHEPKFLILDEPTDGLDPNQKHDIRKFMQQYAKNNAVLVSTHVMEDAEAANRVIMLAKGKIIKDTSIAEFKKISKNSDISEAFRILSKKAKVKK